MIDGFFLVVFLVIDDDLSTVNQIVYFSTKTHLQPHTQKIIMGASQYL